MGQYWRLAGLDARGKVVKACIKPCAYEGVSAKLRGHAYYQNPFVEAAVAALSPGGRFYKSRVVWAGDNAPPEPGQSLQNIYAQCEHLVSGSPALRPLLPLEPAGRFLVNHTQERYVDMQADPAGGYHPLPILTGEGSGQGGRDEDMPLFGTWARDVLSVEAAPPLSFSELVFFSSPEL